MNIKKILEIFNGCINKLLSEILAGKQPKPAHAFAFVLILMGERINTAIYEIQEFVLSDKTLFVELLQKNWLNYDEARFDNKKYSRELFRTLFKQTLLGADLAFFVATRDFLKHKIRKLTLDNLTQVYALYYHAEELKGFLTKVRNIFCSDDQNHATIIKLLFNNSDIKLPDLAEMTTIKALILSKSTGTTTHQGFVIQKAKIIKKLTHIDEYFEYLQNYLNEIKEGKKDKSNITSLYATATCLVAIGVDASTLYDFSKLAVFEQMIKNVLNKGEYKQLLNSLLKSANRLTHNPLSYPSFQLITELSNEFIQKKPVLEELKKEIESLQTAEDNENNPEKEEKVEVETQINQNLPAEKPGNVVELMQQAGSPIFTNTNQNQQSGKRERAPEQPSGAEEIPEPAPKKHQTNLPTANKK